MRIHEIHCLDGIAAGDRIEDPLMLGMRFATAVGALKIDAPAFRRHQIEDAHDAVEDIVLGGIDDLEMEVAVFEIDGLTLSDARFRRSERCAHPVEIVEDGTLAGEPDGGDLVDAAHLVRLANLIELEGNAELREQRQRLDACAVTRHVNSGFGTALDDAQRFEIGQRLANDTAPGLEALGELALGRHALARLIFALQEKQRQRRNEIALARHVALTA